MRIGLITAAMLSAILARAEEGLVIDAATGKPLSGVFVVTDWRGSAFQPAHSSSGCYRVELTRSGEDGTFHVDLLSGNYNPLITDRHRNVALFKPGYEVKFFDRTIEKRTTLQRFGGNFQQRLDEYLGVWRKDCPETSSRLRPLLEAISSEAEALAQTPEDRKKAAFYQLQLDIDSMGYGAANARHQERLRRINQEARTK